HEDPSHDVDHADRLAGPRAPEITPAPGRAGGEVCWPKKPLLPRDVIGELFLFPNVVFGKHHNCALAQDRVGDVAGDAATGGRLLDVGNDEVEALALDERGNRAAGDLASRLSENVADEQNAHRQLTGIRIRPPRRSLSRGSTTRSSPSLRVATALRGSNAPSSPIARAKGPNARSAT